MLRLSTFDGPLMLWVNLSVVDIIHPERNVFAMGVMISRLHRESKLNDVAGALISACMNNTRNSVTSSEPHTW